MRLGSRLFSSVNTKSILFGGVIIFACVAFIFTGFGSLHFGSLGSMNPNTAAIVDSIRIEMNELSNALSNAGLSSITGPQKKYAVNEILKQLIVQKILMNEATKIGWRTDDEEISSTIRTEPFFQDPTTHNFSLTIFKNYIANQQLSDIDFYNYLRSMQNFQNMRNLIYYPIVISNPVAKNEFEMNNTEFNLRYAIVQISQNSIQSKIDEKAKAFALDKANLTQLQNLYAENKNEFHQAEKSKVKSILISYKGSQRSSGEGITRTQNEALALANNTLAQLQKGLDFAKLSDQLNDDVTAKQNHGDLGFVDESKIDPVSLKAISLLNSKSKLSPIVETPFGYRLFLFEANQPAVNKSFDDVKINLAQKIVGPQIRTQLENEFEVKLAEALASQNITNINALLVQNGLSWKYLSKPFKITDSNVSELGNANQLAEEIFTLKKSGEILPKIIDFQGKKAILKLESINQPVSISALDIENSKKEFVQSQTDLFAQKAIKTFQDNYEKRGEIKINPIINE